jgi:pSer/pThr/pTyr-binding forkhead associated (FHA) protein
MAGGVKIYKHFQTPKTAGVYHRLVCLTGEKKGIAYFILENKRVVMGRSEECDIRIFDLKSSREHAEIIQVGEDYIVTDLGSQNGIIVNDLKIKQHVLIDGDKIIVGKTVFKFSKVIVENKTKENLSEDFLEEQNLENEEEKKKDKNLSYILFAIIIVAAIMMGVDDTGKEAPKENIIEKTIPLEMETGFENAINRKIQNNKLKSEKLGRYFHRGLREFREGNYYRAYLEFENARQWDAKDPTASFYLRKTKEKQNEIIESYFSKGTRDKDALNYKAATTAYCAIVRLLIHNNPKDQRIANARENLRIIEKHMGADDKSIVCVKK